MLLRNINLRFVSIVCVVSFCACSAFAAISITVSAPSAGELFVQGASITGTGVVTKLANDASVATVYLTVRGSDSATGAITDSVSAHYTGTATGGNWDTVGVTIDANTLPAPVHASGDSRTYYFMAQPQNASTGNLKDAAGNYIKDSKSISISKP